MVELKDEHAIGRPSRLWLILPVGLTLVCVVLAFVINHYRTELYRVQDRYQMLYFRSTALEDDVSRLRKIDTLMQSLPMQHSPTMTDFELAVLRKKGLDDPYVDLARDLTGEPVLALADNVTVTEPVFVFDDQVCVLSPDRVVAYFESGGRSGHALLSYEVTSDGWISWTVLAHELN